MPKPFKVFICIFWSVIVFCGLSSGVSSADDIFWDGLDDSILTSYPWNQYCLVLMPDGSTSGNRIEISLGADKLVNAIGGLGWSNQP
ncbi:MAG: hypothetical protein LBU12_05725, partial [Deltaproteobacteria bacterium]|nr:hypothetical protein [Deltaproteobacteria bacterium]